MARNKWGIKRVRQRHAGCMSACISMLTGIDYSLLPNVTVTWLSRYNLERGPTNDSSADFVLTLGRAKPVISLAWHRFQEYWATNAGLDIQYTYDKPDVPAMRLVNGGTHVVVELPDGTLIDPDEYRLAVWERLTRRCENVWLTVMPLQDSQGVL